MPKLLKVYDVVIVSYQFTNKRISGGSLGPKIKEYYENNSRGLVTYNMTNFLAEIPFDYKQTMLDKAVEVANKQIDAKFGPTKFELRVHFCNPKISHTGRKQTICYASYTNAIHEFGHLMSLGHANTYNFDKNGKLTVVRSRDPFDCMTIFAPYPSLNPVHRDQVNWYLPKELVDVVYGTEYDLFMLKNFKNTTGVKTLRFKGTDNKPYWISYGTFKGDEKVVFHTSDSTVKYSFLDSFYSADTGKTIVHPRAGVTVSIKKANNTLVTLVVSPTVSAKSSELVHEFNFVMDKVTDKTDKKCVCDVSDISDVSDYDDDVSVSADDDNDDNDDNDAQ